MARFQGIRVGQEPDVIGSSAHQQQGGRFGGVPVTADPGEKQPERTWRNKVAELARPVLEYGGMLGGGALASIPGALTGPGEIVAVGAGGALGYAGGSQAADAVDIALGVQSRPAPEQVTQNAMLNELYQVGGDIGTGLIMEASSPLVSKGVPMAIRGAKAATPQAIKNIPNRLYQSAAKFSTTIPAQQRVKMADLAIKEKISPTIKGWEKIHNKISTLNDDIVKAIDESTHAGKVIKQEKLFKHFEKLRETATLTGSPKTNLAAIKNIENQIKQAGKKVYTAAEAQKLKQNIYKEISTAYGKMSVPYKAESQKMVARAAKEELEAIYPGLKSLNAKEGALIELQKSIEQAANRITNRDILGIGIPIKGTMGATAGGPGLAAAGIAQGIFDAPRVKAALAIALSRAAKFEGNINRNATRAALYAGKDVENKNALSN